MSSDTLIDSTPSSIPDQTGQSDVDHARGEAVAIEAEARQEDEEARRHHEDAAAESARQAAEAEAAARETRRQARLGELADEAAAVAGLEDLTRRAQADDGCQP